MTDTAALLAMHASLPEPRQPAWGLGAARDAAKRAFDERIEVILPLLETLPREGVLRILDVECAQGYFTLAIAHALAARGCAVEVSGSDRHEENIKFCEALAAHHGVSARFVCTPFEAEFVGRQEHARWDAVLVLGGPIVATDAKEAGIHAAVSLLRANSRIAVCEMPRDHRPSGNRLLANHAFSRRLPSSAPLPGSPSLNLYACSDHLAWVGARWFAFDRVIDRSHAGIPDSFSGQRRFFLGADAVVKAFRGDGRHGAFNRTELAAEAAALQALKGERGRYPAVLAQADDGDVVWLARESLPGELLSERMVSGGIDRDAVACGLLGELVQLESRGLHHADLRCWNVLLDGDEVRLIDFGALVRTPSALQRLALCAVLLEIASGQAGHEQPFYASVPAIEAYPSAWQPLLRYLLGAPQSGFRYEEALRILESSFGRGRNRHSAAATRLELDDELLASATREHCDAFRRLREHDEQMERALAAAELAHAAELAEVSGLRSRVHEMERARRVAEQEHVKYTSSLKGELEKSQTYATSLETRLDRVAADARTEREAVEAAHRAAASYSDSLKQSLDKSREYADSLRDSLDQSQAYASSLEERIVRESADAQAYARSLEERIARETADAQRERAALQAAQRDAAAHAEALKRELDASQSEATQLRHELDAMRAQHARMQRRFRFLKFLWPHEPDDPKEPE
jgi:tRNA A-37 threonylcarbamoyl transferase component Bud32